jgi:hypothetical protein
VKPLRQSSGLFVSKLSGVDMPVKKKSRPFNKKLSLKLDRATIATERGSLWGRLKKRLYEWWIFGGKL